MQRILLALVVAAVAGSSLAQYPAKPIRFIVGFPPGGSADPTTRIIGQALSEQLGQPVIVDNRPGADSALAAEQMTRIAPDVPTIAEAGVPQLTVRQWAGVFGPPKLPRPMVERLNREVNAALKRPEVLEKLQGYGYAAEGSTPERLFEINRDDLALWKKLVAEARLPLE